MAVLAGIVVRGLLAASRRGRGDDDVMAMAARVGDTRMPEFIAASMRRRRAEKVRSELPDALDMVSNSLSAGLTLPQALMRNLSHFPPLVSEEFARILYDTRLGYSIGGAFDNFAKRLPIPDVQMVVIASGSRDERAPCGDDSPPRTRQARSRRPAFHDGARLGRARGTRDDAAARVFLDTKDRGHKGVTP